jgi:hypothetical protein
MGESVIEVPVAELGYLLDNLYLVEKLLTAQDTLNAAKNASDEVVFSPLTKRVRTSIDLLEEVLDDEDDEVEE